MPNTSVLVVGAGPTGLTLACGLLSHGVAVRVVDAAAGPAVTSRALGLQPRGQEVLDRLGALAGLPARSIALHRVVVHVGGREIATLPVGMPTRRVPRAGLADRRTNRHHDSNPGRALDRGLIVSQAEIEGELRRRLAELGGTVEWGVPVTDLDAVDADWIVGCDGAHSAVRKAAGIGFPGVPLVERFLLADVRVALPLPRDGVAVWLDGDSMLGAFPLPGDDVWRLMAPDPDPASEPDPLAVLTEQVARRTGITTAVEPLWTSTFRFHRRLADTYRHGRVLLAGDAAHIHSPFGGQGLNTGIGDAENLAWKLAMVISGRAAPELLDTYEAERRPVAAEVLASTSGMTTTLLGGSLAARLVRDHVLVPLMNLPPVQRLIWEQASQLLVSYRRGPLGGRSLRGPRPGDRVPDVPCRRADGSPTRLHAELGSGWAVLGPDGAVLDACAAVADPLLGLVARLAVARSDVLLVRPDGHLAWRGTDPSALRHHLASRAWLTGTVARSAVAG
jgi:2-polyprenyl-6-methoxyphenol hydroxylase-like FAD-dependent oxidoreductase